MLSICCNNMLLLLMFWKMKNYILLMFRNITQIVKPIYSFNDFNWRRMALSCREKVISIIKRSNIKNNGDFYCLSCLHSFRTKYKLDSHKKVCENKDFCNVVMPSEDSKILEFNKYQKYDKTSLLFMWILNV